MRLSELRQLFQKLRDKGFVQSERKGPTGVGHTLERWLGVQENNLPIPDLGGRIEIKATRITTNNLITLFTFNRSVWQMRQADIIRRWGYMDEQRGRLALYSTVSATKPNAQGLQLVVSEDSDMLSVMHVNDGEVLASWDLYHIVGKFVTKFERLLLVHATARNAEGREEFHYHVAKLLMEPSAQTFRSSFLLGQAFIDIRMYLRPKGSVRNHGTGFRIHEHDLPSLFGKIDDLLRDN